MLREPSPQQFQSETITLDERVPEDHLVRKIDAAIDVECIRDTVSPRWFLHMSVTEKVPDAARTASAVKNIKVSTLTCV